MKPKQDQEKVYLTAEGHKKIAAELDNLKNVRRQEVVDRLSLARAQGDLSENNEYAAAREELAFLDGQVEELEDVLNRVAIINQDDCRGSEFVSIGSMVTVNLNKQEHIYHIVGEWEADPMQKKVSHSSPLGQALIGKKTGEEVEFDAPAGKVVYKILKIE